MPKKNQQETTTYKNRDPLYMDLSKDEDECIVKAVKPIDIYDKEKLKENIKSPVCPIFYDDKGCYLNVPNPHDIAVKRLREAIDLIDSKKFSEVLLSDKYRNTAIGLRDDIRLVVSEMYTDAILNAALSYFEDRLKFILSVATDDGYKEMTGAMHILSDCFGNSQLRYITKNVVTDLVATYIELNYAPAHNNSMEQNIVFHTKVESAGCRIVSNIANALNILARNTIYNSSKDGFFGGIKESEYQAYAEKYSAVTREYDREGRANIFYLLSCEFTAQLNWFTDMVYTLLYQMTATLTYLNSYTLKEYYNSIPDEMRLYCSDI